MMKIESQVRLLALVLLIVIANLSFGQTCTGINPGQIFQPATTSGKKIMNPSLDGWVTKFPDFVPPQSGGTSSTCGFNTNFPTAATYNCINQFEFQMFGIPEIGSGDVLNDNIGSSCGITDLIPDNKGYSVYAIRKADPTNSSLYNLIFRFRLGAFNSSVEAYSILIDTDQKFGHVGDAGVNPSSADPNWTTGNPGFELEITLINNSNGNSGGVFVYDIDGIDSCPTPILSYDYDSHVQISQADSKTCNDPDYFFDYYVPLEEVKQKFNLNRTAVNQITDASPLRYAALTNQNAGCAMQGRISDISGVDNSSVTYSTHSTSGIYNSFLALVSNQCGTPLTDLVPGAGGFDKDVTHAPKIDGPLNVGQTVVTGSTCNATICEPGIFIRIDVYHALASPLSTPPQTPRWSQTAVDPRTTPPAGKVTEGPTETTWAITLNAPLQPYDSVVATTQKSETTFANCAGNGGNTSSSSTAVVVKCLLEATLAGTNVNCNGSADGSIAAIISSSPYNGTAPYTYLWSNNQTTATAVNLAPGTYSVIIKDAQRCQAIVNPVTITQPSALAATVSHTNVTCNGANDGTITVTTPTGGYGTYQYSINGGTSWQSSGAFTGLTNGTYNVMIRDAAHTSCTADLDGVGNTTITQPIVLNAAVSSTNISCSGSTDGTIVISAPSGGSGSYEFSVNSGTSWQSSTTFGALTTGSYTVLMRDAAHTSCIKNLGGASNITITQPPVLSAIVSSSNVTCNGANDGAISITSPSGGYGTYQFSINGGTSWQSSGSFAGLTNGTYNVMIRDAAHTSCFLDLDGTANTTISQPAALGASVSSTNVTCNGASDGTITVNAPSGGSGSYQYSINGGTSWQSSGSYTGLAGGTYDVRLRDAAHTSCTIDLDGSAGTTIIQPVVLNATTSSTNATCNGANDGTITIGSPSGGSGTFQFSNNGGTSWQSSATFNGLANGTYSVVMRDAAHTTCFLALGNVVITQPGALNATVATTNVTCHGAANGTITISSPSGGSGSYQFSINGGSSWQTSGTFAGLANGSYAVLIRDAVNTSCTKNLGGTSNITITQPSALSATVSATNVTCNGASDGSITISSSSGGSGTYQFSNNGGTSWQSSTTFSGLPNGTYNVMIRDAVNTSCTIDLDGSAGTTIIQPSVLSATVLSTSVTCNGSSDGSITASSPSGGSGAYQFSLNGGASWQSSGSFTGLSVSIYDVRIRDAAHTSCTIDLDGSSGTTISQPAVLSATVSSTNVTCNGASDGGITVSSASGGSGSYQFSINGGSSWQSSGTFTGISSGTFDVRIRDAAHTSCSIDLDGSGGTTITQPVALGAVVSPTSVTCNGSSDGSIIVASPSGGSASYQYSINGGTSWQSSGSFTGLSSGAFDVRIRDAAHTSCFIDLDGSTGTAITQPAALTAIVSSTNVSCNGSSDGSITISSPSGGSGGFQYSINGGTSWQPSGAFTGLANGAYNVMIRDAANTSCSVDLDGGGNTSITQPNVLSGSVSHLDVSFNGANNGSITINSPTGGSGSFDFSINGGASWQSSASFSGLSNGSYNVRMRDAANTSCSVSLGNVSISQPGALSASVAATNVTCNGASDGTITISSPSGATTYEYSIDGGSAWQGSGSFTGLASATYDVHIRDAAIPLNEVDLDGTINTVVSQPAILNAIVTKSNVSCNGAGDGQINISSVSGGYGTYGFSVDGGTTWQSSSSFTALSASPYDVRIRDAAHTSCAVDLDGATGTTITQPSALNASVASTNVSCNGANDGSISITSPSGGSGSYQFSTNGGASWQSSGLFSGLSGGTFDVRIRNAAQTSCSVDLDGSTGTSITQPSTLGAAVSSTNVTCSAANDGTITIASSTGGYGTYQYSVNGGTSWVSSASFTGLSGGTFDVRIRDAAHTSCAIDLDGTTGTVLIQPSALNATISSTNVTCNGASTGVIAISSSTGGYGTYQYSINGGTSWQSSAAFNNLASATYDVRIRDAANTSCTVDLDGLGNTVITQLTALTATLTSSDVTCNGANDGKINITSPSGGSSSFEFSINGGTSWQASISYSGLANGSYNVTMRDLANPSCTTDLDGSGNTIISQPSTLTATLASTNITCNGASDGAITVSSAAGGNGSYAYSIDGGSNWFSSGSFTALTGNTYNVLVRDAAHTSCFIDLDGSGNTTITQPAVLGALVASTNVTCNGSNNGIISVTSPTGGYGTYEFSRDGGGTWQSSGSFTSLANGTYNLLIRDAANALCSVDLDGSSGTIITQPIALTATVTATNVTSFGADDATISITSPAGGSGSYEYSINGGGNWSTSGTFGGLSGGNYNVQIRDALSTSCAIDLDGVANTVVQQPTAPLSATLTSTNISCSGSSDGTITFSSPAGGYGTYEYTINGGATWSTSSTFTGLSSGSYNAQVRDASYPADVVDLDGIVNTALSQPTTLNASVASTNVTCSGSSDGSISVSGSAGGSGTYEFSISGGTSWVSSGTFTGLATGNYNVVIRDAAHPGCVVDLDGTTNGTPITQPTALSASVSATGVTSPGAIDGSITISSPTGGYGTYEYSTDGGTTWQPSGSFTGLASGAYHVVIRDAAHPSCTAILDGVVGSTTVAQPGVLNAIVASSNITCNGVNDGTITITSSTGGYGTYEYSANGGTSWQSSGSFASLASGTYNVMIRDAAHPNNTVDLDGAANTVLTQPTLLSASVSSTNLTGAGSNDGTIIISNTAGGYGTYEYSISGGTAWQSSGNFSGLSSGTYSVAIRDAAHTTCVIDLDGTANTNILPPLSVAVTSFTNINCFGKNNGSLTVNGFYGVPPYTYSMDGITFTTANTFGGLTSGTYTLWVKDSNSATASTTAEVDQPNAALSVLATGQKNAQCFGTESGSITATGVNGTAPYTYSKDGVTFAISNSFNSLSAGSYVITVQDANGCVATTTASISQPDQISASAIAVSINGDENGSVASVATGGVSPYTYSWTGPDGFIAATDTISHLVPGVYSVVVTDANNCVSGVASYTITFAIYEGVSPNGDGKNDYWRIDGIEGYPNNHVRLFDRFSNVVFETNGYSNESNNWYGQSNHGLVRGTLPDGTYFYSVNLGDGKGTRSGYVILKRQ